MSLVGIDREVRFLDDRTQVFRLLVRDTYSGQYFPVIALFRGDISYEFLGRGETTEDQESAEIAGYLWIDTYLEHFCETKSTLREGRP